MKIKRIKKLKINSVVFNVHWDKENRGGSFSYNDTENKITIGVKGEYESEVFEVICHELMEIVASEMFVRLRRTDVEDDYIFVYDHRQHTTMMAIFAGAISEFII